MERNRLETSLGILTLRSPLLTASGTSGSADELAGLHLGWPIARTLGAFVTKAVTLAPRAGNPEPRIIETRAGLLNSIGLQNKGVERFLREDLPKLTAYGLPLIVNISANTIEEYGEVTARLLSGDGGHIAGLEINVSCPNIKEGGVQFGVDPRAVERICATVRAAIPRERSVLVITKMTPNITDVTEPARAAIAGGSDALSTINTLRGVAIDVRAQKPYFANVFAGLSGPAIKPVGVYLTWECFARIPECRSGRVPLIGIGGISTWEDAIEYILAGASAVGVGTAWFVYPEVFLQIHKGIQRYVEQRGTTVRDLVGKAHG